MSRCDIHLVEELEVCVCVCMRECVRVCMCWGGDVRVHVWNLEYFGKSKSRWNLVKDVFENRGRWVRD